LNNFIASPFQVLGAAGPTGALQWIARADGNGLNPLLQYTEMVIHPPMLYSGYTGFTIPFAFALAALLGRYPGGKWIHLTRRWTMIAWGFQGIGILLGAHWAYAVLGWGGYWAWDPVENASLMPWLTGTARSNNNLDSLVSRESSFLFNNLILLVACVAVISGTLFPALSEWVRGTKIRVDAPFFNKVNLPIGLFLLFLTGVGPLLAWRKTSMSSLRRNFGGPFLMGIFAGAIGVVLGLRNFYVTVCWILSVFVTLTILLEFYRGARVIAARTGSNLFSSIAQLTMRNTRRYGGYVVHFGIVLIFLGISGTAFNQDKQMEMPPGAQMQLGHYHLTNQTFDSTQQNNYTSERATIAVDRDGRQTIMLYPERRFYPLNAESGTMVAIYSTLKEDLYIVYAGRSPETQQPVIHAYLNPLVKWIWLGGAIVAFGTLLALVPSRQAVLSIRAAADVAAAGSAVPAPVARNPYADGYGGHD
jgi:cytochrome c biogenesis factor